ncbi:MAG TPA: hypothetical protein VF070_01985 [Streptosporangiaceae bacterium]
MKVTWSGSIISAKQTVWRQLRALRHYPPGPAAKGDRKKVFGSALEQSQQLFEAAEGVDNASRPLLLFYGLSQAGRAIAAASAKTSNNDFRLVGHGIEVPNLGQRPPVGNLIVINKRKGSFTQLARMLRSGTLPKGASLSQLWASVPTLCDTPLDYCGIEHRPALQLRVNEASSGMLLGWVYGLPQRFATGASEQEIADFFEPYPTLAGHGSLYTHDDPLLETDATGCISVHRVWERAAGEDRREFRLRVTQPYLSDNDRWVYPALGGGTTTLHPLLAWWAVLFTLSVLARYEPASWTENLDVDSNANTVPLEMALDQALDICPTLVLRAIHTVST